MPYHAYLTHSNSGVYAAAGQNTIFAVWGEREGRDGWRGGGGDGWGRRGDSRTALVLRFPWPAPRAGGFLLDRQKLDILKKICTQLPRRKKVKSSEWFKELVSCDKRPYDFYPEVAFYSDCMLVICSLGRLRQFSEFLNFLLLDSSRRRAKFTEKLPKRETKTFLQQWTLSGPNTTPCYIFLRRKNTFLLIILLDTFTRKQSFCNLRNVLLFQIITRSVHYFTIRKKNNIIFNIISC